jgi:hypothetical protein
VISSIDWISFSFDMQANQQMMAFELWGRVAKSLGQQFPLASDMLVGGWEFEPRQGRAPYNSAQQRSDHGVMVYANQRLEHALVEVGGIGMDTLGGVTQELALLEHVASRVTRIDIAVDIYTDVRPDEFCSLRDAGRFKAWSEAVSESGHTIYIGSRSSDRYARVYRYNEPHPRAAWLRVEHVLKAEQAKAAVPTLIGGGLPRFTAMLGKTFGWGHSCWSTDEDTAEALKAWRPERRQGKTVAWLHSQVIPAMLKLHREGVINMYEVWADYISPELDK